MRQRVSCRSRDSIVFRARYAKPRSRSRALSRRLPLMDSLVDDLQAIGVQAGDVLLVHTSFRAVRPVDDGPAGLIAALRAAVGEEGTVVMPSWTEDDDHPFDSVSTPVSRSLGVTAATFAATPGVMRSEHPFAFAAIGAHA